MKNNALRISASVLILSLVGYFYYLEVAENWASVRQCKLNINVYYLTISLLLCMVSYLMDTNIWRVSMNRHLEIQKLTFPQSVAIVNTSSLLKFIPGRIWMYTAQLAWLKKYGIATSKVLHANLICIIASMTVSIYLGLLYIALYTDFIETPAVIACLILLMILNGVYITCNSIVLNRLIAGANRLLGKEIPPLTNSVRLLVHIQFVYACSWLVTGLSGYFLARGVGLNIGSHEVFGLLASMSLSWLAGYLAVFIPGGLGVREGFMLLMLNNVVTVQTALLFPILSRIMLLVAEALLGALALVLGMKLRVFAPPPADPPLQQNLDPLDQPLETPK